MAAAVLVLGLLVWILNAPRPHPAPASQRWGRLVAVSAAWFAWMLAAALWAQHRGAAVHKAIEVLLLAAGVVGLAAAVWRGDARACRAGFLAASVTGLLVLAAAGLVVAPSEAGRVGALGGGPNVFGRNMGVLVIVALAAWRAGRGPGWLPVAGLGCVLVLLSASRAALGATVAGVAAFLLFTGHGLVRRAPALAVVGVSAGAVLAASPRLWEIAWDMFRLRILQQTLAQGNTGDREIYFRLALDLLEGAPLQGVGLGGYAATGIPYPHNLPLEVASEAGLVGLALLLGVGALWAALLRALRPVDPMAIGVWVVLLGSALLSGDLYDSRGLLIWGLLAVAGGLSRSGAAPPGQGERGAS